MKRLIAGLLVTTPFCLCLCQKRNSISSSKLIFDSIPVVQQIRPTLNEVSGIADSKTNAGYIWVEEDSGNPNEIFLISHDGDIVKNVYLKGIVNRDWEDMTLADGSIYLAETGDNAQAYANYKFYKFLEPSINTDTVNNIETINFTYPDGSHDAEAFLVDESKNIYIITKRDSVSKIFKLSYPYASANSTKLVGALPYTGVVSATMNAKEIIVKTYTGLYYYVRQANQTIEQVLKNKCASLPYVIEPQGEAVCFANDGSGFYTISEKGFSTSVNIYFYTRK